MCSGLVVKVCLLLWGALVRSEQQHAGVMGSWDRGDVPNEPVIASAVVDAGRHESQ